MSKSSVFLSQRKFVDSRAGTQDGIRTDYVVTKLVNRLQPEIGTTLSKAEAEALVVGDSTVTITRLKTGQ